MITFSVNVKVKTDNEGNKTEITAPQLAIKLLGDIENPTASDLEGAASYILKVFEGNNCKDDWDYKVERSKEIQKNAELKRSKTVKPWQTAAYREIERRREQEYYKNLMFVSVDEKDLGLKGVIVANGANIPEELTYRPDFTEIIYRKDYINIIREFEKFNTKVWLEMGKTPRRLLELVIKYEDKKAVSKFKEFMPLINSNEDLKDALQAILTDSMLKEMLIDEDYNKELWEVGRLMASLDAYIPWREKCNAETIAKLEKTATEEELACYKARYTKEIADSKKDILEAITACFIDENNIRTIKELELRNASVKAELIALDKQLRELEDKAAEERLEELELELVVEDEEEVIEVVDSIVVEDENVAIVKNGDEWVDIKVTRTEKVLTVNESKELEELYTQKSYIEESILKLREDILSGCSEINKDEWDALRPMYETNLSTVRGKIKALEVKAGIV